MTRNHKWGFLLALLVVLGTAALAVPRVSGQGAEIPYPPRRKVEVLKAEDPTRFVFDEAPVHEGGLPAYGNMFITQGYIYPEGTLNGTNGVLPNGEPEFPDLVLGEWTCRGWFVGDGFLTQEGPVAITTQVFQLGEAYGGTTIITEGYEPIEVNAPLNRAITGGTGEYRQARGDVSQELLGFTEQMGVNLRFEFRVVKH